MDFDSSDNSSAKFAEKLKSQGLQAIPARTAHKGRHCYSCIKVSLNQRVRFATQPKL